MTFITKGLVGLIVRLPRPIRDRIIVCALYRGHPPKGWR